MDENEGEKKSKIAEVQKAYTDGKGGYGTLAKMFGLTASTVKDYVQRPAKGRRNKGQKNRRIKKMCKGKVGHEAKWAAEWASKKLVKKYGPDATTNIYLCPYCEKWHLGREKYTAERASNAIGGKNGRKNC